MLTYFRNIGGRWGLKAGGAVAESYGVPAMPSSYLIDGSGMIRYEHKGYRVGDVDEIRQKIQALINESS